MTTAARGSRGRNNLAFSARPRLLTLLGDQLIRDASVAVFELVKNAYDADATVCRVTLTGKSAESEGKITIEDDGSGMSASILRDAWMVLGTDFRALQNASARRTPRFHRVPLGEKGLGRLSIHKLGRCIRLITREAGKPEYELFFDWDKLARARTLDVAFVKLTKRTPRTFKGNAHGTLLEVTGLRDDWSRGEVRRLYRSINALRSPYKGPTDFQVEFSVPEHEDWLEGLMTPATARRAAVYRVRGSFEGTTVRFAYAFRPPESHSRSLSPRTVRLKNLRLQKRKDGHVVGLDLSKHEIGKVRFELLIFDRDPAVLRATAEDVKGLKDYLDENGGIRIYRDGIRVYDFGEPGTDWLNLDMRRVNTPAARISNNQVLGALQLDALLSRDLREKTNREGFIENEAFSDLRDAVLSLLTHIEAEKVKDQRRLRESFGKGTGQKVFQKLGELREILQSKGQLEPVENALKSVEKEMELYRDQLLHAAVPGLTIGIMLHGAEKIIDELRAATRREFDQERVRALIDRLYRAMRPVTGLLKNPGVATTSASTIIREALFGAEIRLKRHQITLIDATGDAEDFKIRGSRQMLIASVTNLIDNSIHWLEIKNPAKKYLYVGCTTDLEGGPAIIVGDNGPGFGNDDPDDLTAPFFTRRNGGMGLGLYIVSEVMRVNKGQLLFPSRGDVELPSTITGAVVALQFSERQ